MRPDQFKMNKRKENTIIIYTKYTLEPDGLYIKSYYIHICYALYEFAYICTMKTNSNEWKRQEKEKQTISKFIVNNCNVSPKKHNRIQ